VKRRRCLGLECATLSRAHAPRRLFHPLAEGVCYAEKDYNLAKHPEMDVPNLHVRIALLNLDALLPLIYSLLSSTAPVPDSTHRDAGD